MLYRFANHEDVSVLATLNQRLIRDEGHRNPMTLPQLAERMAGWLQGEYRGVVFEDQSRLAGYALFREEAEHIYLRQLFVLPEYRRKGIASTALKWLWANAWQNAKCVRIEVLVGNETGRQFWQSAGFHEYCITMEAVNPNGA